jgi:hypothetical protein
MTTDSPERTSAPTAGVADASPLSKIVELIGAIAAPITVLAALLYYFGWVRTNAVFSYFGADPDLLAFGPPEYLTRSAGTAFKPIVILLLITALVLIVRRAVDTAERRWPGMPIAVRGHRFALRPVALLMLVVGVVAVSFGVAAAVGLAAYLPASWAALCLGCGGLAAWYGLRHLVSPPGARHRSSLVERVLLFGMIATALFWATAAYSQQVGNQRAEFIDANLATLPEVTIHSAENLNLWTAPGTVPGQGKFPHTYDGSRLLYYANQRWFLLTGELTASGRHRLVIVRDDDSIRVDLAS